MDVHLKQRLELIFYNFSMQKSSIQFKLAFSQMLL